MRQEEGYKVLLASSPLFDGIGEERREELASSLTFVYRSYKKGESVVFFAPALGILLSGRLRVEGREDCRRAVINEMTPGAVFGFATLFCEGEEFSSDLRAASAVTAAWLEEGALCALIERCPRVAFNVMAMQSRKIRFLNRRIRAFTAPGGEEKLKRYLASLPKDGDGKIVLPVGMAPLAKRLGVGRATLYRAFDKLEKEGVIVPVAPRTFLFDPL